MDIKWYCILMAVVVASLSISDAVTNYAKYKYGDKQNVQQVQVKEDNENTQDYQSVKK
jgi:hypothetical protein